MREGKTVPTIQAVQRAAVVLSAFTVSQPHLSLNDITALLGTSKATAHRYTKALREAGLVLYDEQTSLYSLGRQVLKLASSTRAGLPLITLSQTYLDDLAVRVNQSAVLSIWDGLGPTVIGSADGSNYVVTISIRPGARLDAVHSAQGRIFCAHLPPEQIPRLSEHLERVPRLRTALQDIRTYGVCVNTPEVTGVHSIAAPVFNRGELVASLAVVGTATAIPRTRDHATVKALIETAEAISTEISSFEKSLSD